MPCTKTVEADQKEYDFFLQLVESSDIGICVGPITTLGFTGPALQCLMTTLDELGMEEGYLDAFNVEVVDSELVAVEMCPKHWILHSRAIGALALSRENDDFGQLAYYMFRLTCMGNSWDHKEITNYLKTVIDLEKKE
jgi:hypothetical protein